MRIPDLSKSDADAQDHVDEAWSNSYKKSINCSHPKGFSQKAHCAARRKRRAGGKTKSKPVREATDLLEAKRKRARTLIDGMIKTLIARGRTRDEAIADLKKQIDSRFYEQVMGGDPVISESQKLARTDPVERWITAFKNSSHPKFKGKSPEQRERMARAAHYRAVHSTSKPVTPRVAEADDLDELRIDNRDGWGAVPYNQNVGYRGLRVAMKPSMFLRLAHELEHPHSADDIEKHLRSGGAIGAPFLMVAIPQDWFEGDMSHPAEIYGHEGRNRMNAALRTEGDQPVETHLFFGGGIRNRDLTPEIVDRLNQEVISQRGSHIKGPWFSMAVSEVAKVRISKDPNDLGAYVDDDGEPEPTIRLPLPKITSVLEPDEYHAEKPGAIERVERMAKAIEAGRDMPAILVRRHGDGYQVLDGHHRFKAYRQVGAESIPARVVDPDNITGDVDEAAKQRLDRRCWTGYRKQGTKIKGGVRVNNCVANENMDHGKDDQAVPELRAALLARKDDLKNASNDEIYGIIDKLMTRIARSHGISGQKLHDMWVEKYKQIPDTWIMNENFADGKGPGRPGDSQRHGIPKGATMAQLRKAAKAPGRKGQLARWQINMRRGRANKNESISEADINPNGAALTVFDMDETLFHTKARVYVVRDGDIVHRLTNQEYNTYHLKPGETFDYSEFRDAKFFHDTSVPIERMWRKAQNVLDNIGRRPGSRVIIVTARTDLDDRETFLDTFRKHGLDIDKVHVHRAGNLPVPAAAAKKAIIATYLNTGRFDSVRLFDDAESNLRSFLSLKDDYPGIRFTAYLVLPGGNVAQYQS